MAVSVADCCHRSKLNCSASVSMSSSMFYEEESQEGIKQTDLKWIAAGTAYRIWSYRWANRLFIQEQLGSLG
jgi:hypothetical protein